MVFESTTYSVLLLSGASSGSDAIRPFLPPSSFYPVDSVSSAGEARRLLLTKTYDIIIINAPLTDESGTEAALCFADKTSAAILLITGAAQYEKASSAATLAGVLTMSRPLGRQMLETAIGLLRGVRTRIAGIEEKNAKLVEKINEIRIINHAKWLLIDYLKMTEAEAHGYIEKQAMDMRISKRTVAENIIGTYET